MGLKSLPSVLGKVAEYAKAVAAAATAVAAALSAGLVDGSLSVGDYVTVVLAGLGALGIVAALPNKAPQRDEA